MGNEKGLRLALLVLLLAPTFIAGQERSVFKLEKGEVVSVSEGKRLTSSNGKITSFTTSPDQKYLVYVTRMRVLDEYKSRKRPVYIETVSMSILELSNRVIVHVGKDLDLKCCLIMDSREAQRRGHSASSLKSLNGGFWNDQNQLLVHMLNEKFDGIEYWLSMDGKLHGDV